MAITVKEIKVKDYIRNCNSDRKVLDTVFKATVCAKTCTRKNCTNHPDQKK